MVASGPGAEDELLDPLLEDCPLKEDSAVAAEATEAYVGTKPGHLPIIPAAGVSLAQADNIAQIDF